MYCTPANAGLNSQTSAVAHRIGRLMDAMDDEINGWIVSADDGILTDIRDAQQKIKEGLEAEGWIISYTKASLEASDKCRVYPPGSPAGKKIRKWREAQ